MVLEVLQVVLGVVLVVLEVVLVLSTARKDDNYTRKIAIRLSYYKALFIRLAS